MKEYLVSRFQAFELDTPPKDGAGSGGPYTEVLRRPGFSMGIFRLPVGGEDHLDTFPDYKPHITLAYLKADSDWQAHVEPLSERLRGTSVNVTGLNYGD
jgi:hypothetical protein